MIMEVFRIVREPYASKLEASGIANRWNKRGQNVIYTGFARSLSTLEMIVHRSSIVPSAKYKVMVISIPDDLIFFTRIDISCLKENWNTLAAFSRTQELGSKWYNEQDSLVLQVPSAIITQEFNYIINTEHPEFKQNVRLVGVEDYFFDQRLLL